MAPEIDTDKVDKVVSGVRGDYEHSYMDDTGFQDDQAKGSLERLLTLNAEEFKNAWDKLDDDEGGGQAPLKQELAKEAHDQNLDNGKYTDLVASLYHNDVNTYYKAKQKQEADADPLLFGTHVPDNSVPDFSKHAGTPVILTPPDGASAQLIALVQDTQFTMQWDLDSLGLHTAKTAPPVFSPVLVGDDRATTVDGWSDIRAAHEKLSGILETRQKDYNSQHKVATDATFDSEVTGKELFTDLEKRVKDVQGVLDKKLTGWTRDGDKLTKKLGGTPHDPDTYTEVIFERNTADNDLYKTSAADKNKFFLTPAAEQKYYVEPLKNEVRKWNEKYEEAAKKYLKDADKVPAPPHDPAPKHPPKTGAGTGGDGDGGGGTGTGGGGTGAGSGAGAGTPAAQNTDYSALFKDALANSSGGQGNPAPNPDPSSPGTTPTDTTTTPTDTSTDQVVDEINAARDRIEQGASVTPAGYNPGVNTGGGMGGNTGGNAGGNSGGGSGFDPSTLMAISAMTQAAQNRNQDNGGVQNDRGEPRRRPEPGTVTPASTTPGAPTAPGAPVQPAVTADPTTPPPTNGPKPMKITIPGLAGTQDVTSVVYDALTKELNNPNGCDGRAAYEGTPGASAPGTPWTQVTSGNLHTGDVVQWANRSALVVMTEHGPQILINGHLGPLDENGQLVRFDQNNMPAGMKDEFKDFQGFFHPNGADLMTDGQAPAETKPADPPKVTAPAAPGAVPASTPPGPSGEI